MRMVEKPCHEDLNGPSTAPRYQPGQAAQGQPGTVIDIFALAVTHGLIALALWRLVWRDDLNGETAAKPPLDRGASGDA
jgi:hypothetical protein